MSSFDAVHFPNRDGLVLHGMLHVPEPSIAKGICILMLSPGIKGRVGPHRLYLKLAERLVPLGFHLLRFDFYGLGDSEGELTEDVLADMYNTIQGGRYVDDTLAAMDWMQQTHGIRRFIGSGLCGGSITSLHAAARDTRIVAMIGIGLPVVLDGGVANWGKFLTKTQLEGARKGLIERMFRPKSWLKFLSGKSNYRVIWRIVLQLSGLKNTQRASGSNSVVDDTNPLFAPAFFKMLDTHRPMLLIYSGADRLQSQFEEKFENRNCDRFGNGRRGYVLHTIAHANHIMSNPEWVEELCNVSAQWLASAVKPAPPVRIR